MDNYLEGIALQVKNQLTNYVISRGRTVHVNGSFQCFFGNRHNRGDADFSAHISKKEDCELWYCQVCKKGGTIYDLAYEVEGLSLSKQGFITTTIELATRFGIPVDISQIPGGKEKGMNCYTQQDMFKEIENFIVENGDGVENLTNGKFGRMYTPDQAHEIMSFVSIGCVSTEDLTRHMKTKFGNKVDELSFYDQDRGLLQPYLFNKDRIVMTVKNRSGIPVAFSGRISEEKLADKSFNHAKYLHSKGFEGMKKETLFLIDVAKEHIKKTRNVRFVEGNFDAITMHLYGFKNTVAILGSAIQQDAVDVIAPMKPFTMTYMLDPDKAGIAAVRKGITEVDTGEILTDAVILPKGYDPDRILREGDIDLITKTRDVVSAVLEVDETFYDKSVPADVRYNNAIDFVVKCTPHSAKYREYATTLSRMFGYHEDDIVYNLQEYNTRKLTMGDEEKKVNNIITNSLGKPMPERIIMLEDATEKLRSMSAEIARQTDKTTWQEFMSLVTGESKFPKVLKTDLRLDKFADIECGSLTFASGWPSNGKSSVLQYLSISMARKNKDLKILYVSTDDVPKKAMAGFLGIITGIPKRDVKSLIDMQQFIDAPQVDARLDEIRELFSNQIILRGLKDCSSTDRIKQEISNIRKVHNRDLMVVVDAMNNLDDVKKDDQRVGIENAIRNFKNMAVTYDVAMVPVSHLNKQDGKEGERPRLKNLKGTSFIEYESKTVLLVHMDAHYNRNTELRWKCGQSMFPVIEINVAKDKDQEANNIVPVHFNPMTGEIINPSDIEHEKYLRYIDGDNKRYGGDDPLD